MSDTMIPGQISAVLRSHVERSLQDIWGLQVLVTDNDGDYPFRCETAACWVGILGGSDPSVRVFAHAAYDVPKSVRMFAELNELNQRIRWAKMSWCGGIVVVDCAIHWTQVDHDSVERALDAVTGVADDIGTMVAAVYGGATPFPLECDATQQDEDAA